MCWSLKGWTALAEFGVSGLDDLILSLQDVAQLPEDVQDEMLNAQADVVLRAQQAEAQAIKDTGQTARSLKKGKPKTKKGVRSISITFSGSRKRGNTVTRNAEIAFINEYGKHGVPARNFIRKANDQSAVASTQAAAAVYDKYLQSKEL